MASESTTAAVFKMSTELTMMKIHDNASNAKSYPRIIKPRNLSKDLTTSKSHSNSSQKYYTELDSTKSVFGPYCLKPKKQQNSPLIYSTCQSIINTSSASVPSFYLNPIIRDHNNSRNTVQDSATAKIMVGPTLPQSSPTAFIPENIIEGGSNLLRRTSFADLQKQKLISSCKELTSPSLHANNDAATYTTISRMIRDDKSLSPKRLPPCSTSPLDPTFTSMISGCAFNYCDSAVAVLNKSANKLKKSNSIASNQYFSQYMDKISSIKNIEKRLKDKKLSHSSMDIAEVKSPISLIVKKDEMKAPRVPPPPLPHISSKFSLEDKKTDDVDKREVYSFNNDGKLTKSCSTSYINNDKNSNGVTYINIQQLNSNSVLVNHEISEFRLDVEKQKFESELKQKGLLNDPNKKIELEDFKNEETVQNDQIKLKELSKIFDTSLKENDPNLNKSVAKVEIENYDEKRDKLKEINENIEANENEIDKEENIFKRLPKLPKKTESFNYKSIKNSPNKKYMPHTLAPLIIKSKQFFQQETNIPPHPGQTVNLKRNTSLPAKTLTRKNMSQFYDIRSKIQQFEKINTDSSFNINSILSGIETSTDNIATESNAINNENSPNKQKSDSNNMTTNEKTNIKVPDDFQSTIKVKQLKSIFESVNGNN